MKKSASNDDEVMSILSKLIRPILKKDSTPKKIRSRNNTTSQWTDEEDEQQGWDEGTSNKQTAPQNTKERLYFKAAMQLTNSRLPLARYARLGLQKCKFARFAAVREEQ